MPNLSVYLLGDFQVRLDGQLVTRKFRTNKERALFAYLVVESERPHTRDALAELLWPGRGVSLSRTNLRQALSGVRKVLNDQQNPQPFLEIVDESIQLNPQQTVWLDTSAFATRFQASLDHIHLSIAQCPTCIQRLSEAVDLYRQEFLAGLYLEENEEFYEWLIIRREQYSRYLLSALEHLAEHYQQAGDYDIAQKYAWKYVNLEPLEEAAHRRVMELLALCGRRSAAIEQFHACKQILKKDLLVEPSTETVQLFEKIKSGAELGGDGSLLEVSGARLPVQFTSFVDRERELKTLLEQLAEPTCRLISIVGPVGCGKTRLAIEAAQEIKKRFKDGVYFISAEELNAGDMLLSQLIRTLGLTIRTREPHLNLVKFLQTRQALLVIDHFDGIIDQVDLLLDILRSAPDIKILLTSRQRLNLQSVSLFELSGLEFPDSNTSQDPLAYPAVQLFVQRAQRSSAGFSITTDNIRCVVQLCQIFSGLPLAIELATSRLRMMSCARLLKDCQVGLDTLVTTVRDVPERHRSFAAALDSTWDILSPAEKSTYSRLSVFQDRFDMGAAKGIAGATPERMIALVEKSLVVETTDKRYTLLPLLQKYAADKLAADPQEHRQTLCKHADYFLGRLIEKAGPKASAKPPVPHLLIKDYQDILHAVALANEQEGIVFNDIHQESWRKYQQRMQVGIGSYPPEIQPTANQEAFINMLRFSLSYVAQKALLAAVLIVQLNPSQIVDNDQMDDLIDVIKVQLREILRAHDSVFHIGADVFGIILENLSSTSDAYIVARKIYRRLENPIHVGGREIPYKLQIGVSRYPTDSDDAEQLFRKAETTPFLSR